MQPTIIAPIPVRPGEFLRLVASGKLGPAGFMEASRVADSALCPSGEDTVGVWTEYRGGQAGCGCTHSVLWDRKHGAVVRLPPGSLVLLGHWRESCPGAGHVAMVAHDVPKELHRAVAAGDREDLGALFKLLPMSERLEVVDESASTSQRTLSIYFDGQRACTVDNTRPNGDMHPLLGFMRQTVEEAAPRLKQWFVQRYLRFTSEAPGPDFDRRFEAYAAQLYLEDLQQQREAAGASRRQARLERAQADFGDQFGAPQLLRERG